MSDRRAALELEGVCKRFGAFEAVRGIDLRVGRGEVFGFLGPNGAGKTTTLRMITGLLRPTAGSVRVAGIDAVRQPIEAKRRIGFISDRPFLYEKLTGGEFLRFVGGLWGMRAADIESGARRWMERFDMLGWVGEPIEAYSHGMRQRLLLCSALLHAPDILVMDEPMVGLDPRGASRLKQVVRELAETQQMTVVLSTHTLDVVEQVCDTVAIIHRGRIVTSGTLDVLRQGSNRRLEEIFLELTEQDSDAPTTAEATVGD
jgi:ABC-2 type transport system ATP-binding protein